MVPEWTVPSLLVPVCLHFPLFQITLRLTGVVSFVAEGGGGGSVQNATNVLRLCTLFLDFKFAVYPSIYANTSSCCPAEHNVRNV